MLIFQFYFTRLIFIVNTFALILQLGYDLSISILNLHLFYTMASPHKVIMSSLSLVLLNQILQM